MRAAATVIPTLSFPAEISAPADAPPPRAEHRPTGDSTSGPRGQHQPLDIAKLRRRTERPGNILPSSSQARDAGHKAQSFRRFADTIPSFETRDAAADTSEVDTAVAKALQAAEEKFEKTLEDALANERRHAAKALTDARAAWSKTEGERLGTAICDGLAALGIALGDRVAEALQPALETLCRERAVTAFCELLQPLLETPDHPVLTVKGQPDLLRSVKAQLGDTAPVAYVPTAGASLEVEELPTTVSLSFVAWAEALTNNGPGNAQ